MLSTWIINILVVLLIVTFTSLALGVTALWIGAILRAALLAFKSPPTPRPRPSTGRNDPATLTQDDS